MPTILREGPYRYYFYSDEGKEPPHVHVRHDGCDCKFWLLPVIMAVNRGIPLHRLNEIERTIRQHQQFFIKKYHEHRSRHH